MLYFPDENMKLFREQLRKFDMGQKIYQTLENFYNRVEPPIDIIIKDESNMSDEIRTNYVAYFRANR